MNAPGLSRRRFLALSGAAATGALFPSPAPARAPLTALGKTVAGNTAFAIDLFRKLSAEKGNTFFSPFSTSVALAMTSAGAAGKTLEEMQQVLRLPDDPHLTFGSLLGFVNGLGAAERRKHELVVANAIWAMKGYPWRKEFTDILKNAYKAGVSDVDFGDPEAARKQINAWAEKETKEKIRELIPANGLTPLTRMVLTNAVYFKGEWADKFHKGHTKDGPFTHADGTKADAPFMTHSGQFNYGEFTPPGDTPVQVLELPYAGNKASMLVFLPKDPAGVGRLIDSLQTKHFTSGERKSRRVELHLPRFRVESAFMLKPVLVELGMKLPFDEAAADFTGMHTGKELLYLNAVRHKAFVDVNEDGTEAAAATSAEATAKSIPPEAVPFRADRPFVFAIRDETTDSVLFLGRYGGPKA